MEADRPTSVRWKIVGLLLAYAALVHFNRISIAVAGTERLMSQFDISPALMGSLSSAYLWTYTIMMTPGGWFIDRFGARAALLVVGFGSMLCVGMTGVAGLAATSGALIVPALFAIRGLMGIANAPFHPGAAYAVSRWIPGPAQVGVNGMVNAAALAGISSTFYVFGFMMDRLGWPGAFLCASGVTGVAAAAWWAYAAGGPREHRGVNDAERRLIGTDSAGRQAGARITEIPPWKNRSVILLTISYGTVGYFQYMFFYWIQYYFDKVLGLGKDDSRLYATIPSVAMAIGMAVGGRLIDRAQSRLGPRRGRAGITVTTMIVSAVLLGAGVLCRQPVWIVTCFSFALGILGICEGAFWTTATDLGGEKGGVAAAIVNTGGNAGGALAPVLTPLVSENLGWGWTGGIALACGFCFLGALTWFWIDPDEGIRRPPESSPVPGLLRDGAAPSAVS